MFFDSLFCIKDGIMKIIGIMGIKNFIDRAIYVLRVSRKPDQSEINASFRIVVIGIVIFGIIGLLVRFIMHYIFGE